MNIKEKNIRCKHAKESVKLSTVCIWKQMARENKEIYVAYQREENIR